MAENKKSIIVYADWLELFESLSNEEAGNLIKHFFRYVNDLNPTPPDRLTEISFIPIKQSLKRDLDKWDKIKEKRSLAGKASAEKRKQNATNPTCVENVQQASTNPTVSVNDSVSVSVSVNDNVIKKKTKQKTFSLDFILTDFRECFNKWLLYKKEKKQSYKSEMSIKSSYNQLVKLSGNNAKIAGEIIEQSIANNWAGLFELKQNTNQSKTFIKKQNDSDY